MTLSKREKVMIAFLVILIILAGFYIIYFKPQLEEIATLDKEAEALKQRVDITKTNISLTNQVDEKYKKLNEKVNAIVSDFFPSINQEKLIVILDEFINSSDVEAKSMNFTETELTSIKESVGNNNSSDYENQINDIVGEFKGDVKIVDSNNISKSSSSNNNEQEQKEITLRNMTTTIFFQGNYNDVVEFLSRIEEYNKKIIIKNLNLVKEEENNQITGSVILKFYAVPKLELQDIEYYQWDYDNKYGKDNPFYDNGLSKSNGSESNGNNVITVTDGYDFGMWVKPITSDNTTVGVGYYDDKTRETYVYADNIGVEPVKITFKKENNKYLYRYSTSAEAYPKDEEDFQEFDPKGNFISMKIFTNKRNSSNDISGAKVTIDNITDLKLVVDIPDDDEERPRVNIVSGEGDILINRN
ncbi:hypothetical protein [Sporosalibacterium faouarense]|uniref:hypothetical protein n=1 Tax=Sporosalibacterium faouarense TaxID=516123 RepID=UPI00192AF1FF|nr:hypothetical protein [Sporosalibacterium faouarense]